jgi:hypothetical protein
MLSKREARELVEGELTRVEQALSRGEYADGIAIMDSETMEFAWGWVFFYQSKKFLEMGGDDFALWGNAPFIVNKKTGEVRATGTSRPIAHYVREYEAELDD